MQHLQTTWHLIGLKTECVPSHTFASSPLLSAMGNDLGFDDAFSAPLVIIQRKVIF